MKAIWNGELIAESDDTVIIEGNHYFPKNSIKQNLLQSSNTHTECPWKGTASYYDVNVNGEKNRDAAWFYPKPKEAAKKIQGMVAFWKGVEVKK